MLLIVGLGNPGKKYTDTRHNIGFKAVDRFQKENNFPAFSLAKKQNALISEGRFFRKKIILAKPQTLMNSSGTAAKKLIKDYKLKPEDLVIIHDDIDLLLGRIKIIKNRGAAGHKGVESIIKELRTRDFARVRIGIQPKSGKPKNPERFVLQIFTKKEKEIIETTLTKACKALTMIIEEGIEKAMNEFNKK